LSTASSGTVVDVRLAGVRRAFGEVVAVDGVDLAIRQGEFFTMLGPSGSGKTTCLRIIAGSGTTTLPPWILGAFRNAQALPEVNAAATVILLISLPMIATAAYLMRDEGAASRVVQGE